MTSTSGAALILPRGLLRRPDFVTACAARDFAAVFAMVRKYAGISQVRVAAALDMTPSRVGEVIRRQRQITSLDVIERISDRLRIPGRMLGLAPRPWEPVDASGDPGETALSDIAAILGDEHLELTGRVGRAHRTQVADGGARADPICRPARNSLSCGGRRHRRPASRGQPHRVPSGQHFSSQWPSCASWQAGFLSTAAEN
jgi:transcriptional regulator with XRE-family HTH domain